MGLSKSRMRGTKRRSRGKKRRSRGSKALKIHKDLLMDEILTRLPAKTLMRFKCVSKLWSSFISSIYFTSRFLTVPSRPRPRLYICLADQLQYRKSLLLSSALDHTSPSTSFVVDRHQTNPRRGHFIFQTVRGFMCYTMWRKLRIFNPATRQLVTLPTLKSGIISSRQTTTKFCYYFGHDPVTNQSKVLSVSTLNGMLEHWIFVLGGRGCWKKATLTSPDFCRPYSISIRGLSINGVIYYLAWFDVFNSVLVSFNIRSEEFKIIQVPCYGSTTLRNKVYLLEIYDGKIGLLDTTHLDDKGVMDLKVLNDVGNEEWTNKTLVLQPCHLDLIKNVDTIFTVNRTTQSGKVIFKSKDLISPFCILSYDLQTNDMRKIEVKGVPEKWFRKDKEYTKFDVMFMDQSESIVHLET